MRAVSDASAPLAGVRVQVTQDGLEVGEGPRSTEVNAQPPKFGVSGSSFPLTFILALLLIGLAMLAAGIYLAKNPLIRLPLVVTGVALTIVPIALTVVLLLGGIGIKLF